MSFSSKWSVSVSTIVCLSLWMAPVPLLPPHRLAAAVQWSLGFNWKLSYLLAVIGLQFAFYGAIGLLTVWALPPASNSGNILLQITALPLLVVLMAVVIRSMKLGHLPVWSNTLVPIIACLSGSALGVGLHHRRWKATFFVATAVAITSVWGMNVSVAAELSRVTELSLMRMVAEGKGLPSGEGRLAGLVEAAFAPTDSVTTSDNSVLHNRGAILALGIAIGHERLAPLVGLQKEAELVRQATSLRPGTMLRGREDWTRHYALSAALAVLENPLISEAAGLLKEQLDTMPNGSGFSFGDLMADRAGIRFALAATRSEASAKAIQTRIQRGFVVDDFFPLAADLPEKLTTEQLSRDFGGVGGEAYRNQIRKIDARLDDCAGLKVP